MQLLRITDNNEKTYATPSKVAVFKPQAGSEITMHEGGFWMQPDRLFPDARGPIRSTT